MLKDIIKETTSTKKKTLTSFLPKFYKNFIIE